MEESTLNNLALKELNRSCIGFEKNDNAIFNKCVEGFLNVILCLSLEILQ